MEEKRFWKTKAGGLTLAFLVTMVGFVLILIGVNREINGLTILGLTAVVAAMLYSPVRVFLLEKRQ